MGAAGIDFWKSKRPNRSLPDLPPCAALYSTAYSLDEYMDAASALACDSPATI